MSNARFSILQARAVKDKRVSDSQFRTLAALGMYADTDGWCFPSLTTLGKDLSKSKQAVGRDTVALRKLGYLEVTARYDEKTHARRSSLYRLKFDLPRQHDVDTPSTNTVDAPSTNHVDAPSTSEVDVNDPINEPKDNDLKEIDSQIFTALENLTGGLNSGTPRYVDTWKEKHPVERIMEAIALAKTKGRKPVQYVDSILIGWEANGYPKTREDQVKERRTNGKSSTPPSGKSVADIWYEKKMQEAQKNV